MSDDSWLGRHRALVALDPERKRRSKLVFLGDSIVEGWVDASWDESFGVYDAVRLGIGGDMTQHLLWRVEHGELDQLEPKVLVLLIGTNNLGNASHSSIEVGRGVAALARVLEHKLPRTTLLVLGILPRDEPSAPLRQRVAETNALIARLDNGTNVRYLDVSESFLSADRTIPRRLMADGLHPTPEGYRVFARSLLPVLTQILTRP
ncbi:MAG TPA: GDSL-type esterase/lipase family protein [Polyangiaceae bacterium]|nr:GDSL-type esterase/lipase family protein [Polyangiaceae bacterium]